MRTEIYTRPALGDAENKCVFRGILPFRIAAGDKLKLRAEHVVEIVREVVYDVSEGSLQRVLLTTRDEERAYPPAPSWEEWLAEQRAKLAVSMGLPTAAETATATAAEAEAAPPEVSPASEA